MADKADDQPGKHRHAHSWTGWVIDDVAAKKLTETRQCRIKGCGLKQQRDVPPGRLKGGGK